MPTAKIMRYQLRFDNELVSVADDSVKDKVKASGDAVNHRIRGYYGNPTNSAKIKIEFECAHPDPGPVRYVNGNSHPEHTWTGTIEIAGAIRETSAVTRARELVVTPPPSKVGAVIECSFGVKERWSREMSTWIPVGPGHSDECDLPFSVEP